MSQRFTSLCAFATALFSFHSISVPAQAADLPQVKISESNPVPECATPGRLMSYIKSRNAKLDPKFNSVATEYMRHGEDLGIRWDYAFFQMMLETDTLRFTGDVDIKQNNFAGLGATGRGAKGESFKTVSDGVRAHLEHLLMYTGEKIESPIAERTKNIQEWGVLTSWQKTIKGPMTYAQLARQWAPTSKSYPRDVETLAGLFFKGACKGDDPNPEMIAEARKGRDAKTAGVQATSKSKGTELAKRALDEARAEGGKRSALGATSAAANATEAGPTAATASLEGVKILNAEPAEEITVAAVQDSAPQKVEAQTVTADTAVATGKTAAEEKSTPIETAALAAPALGQAEKPAATPAASTTCRVFTASYGGAKSIIIKALDEGSTNYTVLDVNEGSEKREAEAYIGAYAKGGETVGEFSNQEKALEKAFELCPEG
jgi:hypothetical protein